MAVASRAAAIAAVASREATAVVTVTGGGYRGGYAGYRGYGYRGYGYGAAAVGAAAVGAAAAGSYYGGGGCGYGPYGNWVCPNYGYAPY